MTRLNDNNRHYTVVGYDGAKIIFTVSHILTDASDIFYSSGVGFYFGKKKTSYQDADKIDFFPLTDDYEPKNYKLEKHFVPPEINSSGNGTMIETFTEIPTRKLKVLCNKYNVSAQIAVSILLAKTVQRT